MNVRPPRRDRSMLGAKAINMAVFVMVVVAAAAFPLYWKMLNLKYDARELMRMADADPLADLAHAITEGDIRLIGVEIDEQVLVPGIEQYHELYAGRFALRVLEGDKGYHSLSTVEQQSRRRAYEYMVRYNRELLIHLLNAEQALPSM